MCHAGQIEYGVDVAECGDEFTFEAVVVVARVAADRVCGDGVVAFTESCEDCTTDPARSPEHQHVDRLRIGLRGGHPSIRSCSSTMAGTITSRP